MIAYPGVEQDALYTHMTTVGVRGLTDLQPLTVDNKITYNGTCILRDHYA